MFADNLNVSGFSTLLEAIIVFAILLSQVCCTAFIFGIPRGVVYEILIFSTDTSGHRPLVL